MTDTTDQSIEQTIEQIIENSAEQLVEPQARPARLIPAFFGGSGIGLLFGVIMGMSITPTVATILGALTGLLAAILGLNDQHFNDAKAIRVGAFGYFCVFGALFGLFVRSHNLMSPSMIDMKNEYVAVGYSEPQALEWITQKVFGVRTNTTNIETAGKDSKNNETTDGQNETPEITSPQMSEIIAKQHSSLLFSAPVELDSCEELEDTDHTLPLDEIINNYELTGGMWEFMTTQLDANLTPDQQKNILLAAKNAICASNELNNSPCEDKSAWTQPASLPQVTQFYQQADTSWATLQRNIHNMPLSDNEKLHTLVITKLSICEQS